MYGWLNIGTQKQKMGQLETCPCCGIVTETQHHLYLCTNENMRDTSEESIKKAKSKLVKDGIPSLVYNEFIEQICLATRTTNPDTSYVPQPGRIQEVASMQARLGEEASLKGFIHKEWTRILNKMWRPALLIEKERRCAKKTHWNKLRVSYEHCGIFSKPNGYAVTIYFMGKKAE